MLRRPQRPDRSRFCATCQLLAAAALALGVTATIGAIALPAAQVYGPPPAAQTSVERDDATFASGPAFAPLFGAPAAKDARLAAAPARPVAHRGAVEIVVR